MPQVGQSSLLWAAQFGLADEVHQLLGRGNTGVDQSDTQGNTALHLAAMYGHEYGCIYLMYNCRAMSCRGTVSHSFGQL